LFYQFLFSVFRQFKNIDTAFSFIRAFSIAFLVANVLICCYTLYVSASSIGKAQGKVFVLAGNKLMEAFATERKEKLPVEIRDHVSSFHRLFFNLEPDEELIRVQVAKSLYLCDSSARIQYKTLLESGFYSGIVSGNISQRLLIDSIQLDLSQSPWYMKFYGKLMILRSTSVVTRSLVSEAFVRDLSSVSDNNPHGFLLERWKILDNRDLGSQPR
jgi:conjugative transposon TraK protein